MKNQVKTFKELYEYCATLTDNKDALSDFYLSIRDFLKIPGDFSWLSFHGYIDCLANFCPGFYSKDLNEIWDCILDYKRNLCHGGNVCPEDVEFFKLVTPSASELATADK